MKNSTSFRISQTADRCMVLLGEHFGLSKSAVVEMAVRELARNTLPQRVETNVQTAPEVLPDRE